MVNIRELREGLWTFPIVLPDNPLKWLNCYVVKGCPDVNGGRSLLIDTGFNRADCFNELLEGMNSLGLDPGMTEVFLTHIHSDHTGNAARLFRLGCRIFMSETDYELSSIEEGIRWKRGADRICMEGMPDGIISRIYSQDSSIVNIAGYFDAMPLHEGDAMRYGKYEFECIMTPGHTPGHMCLYERRAKIMLLGDHVLFDITPNICAWTGVPDSLRDYLISLDKISRYEVDLPLPGHRSIPDGKTMNERIHELNAHHEKRLAEILSILRIYPEVDAYFIASRMTWKIHAQDWETFPPSQQYFAMSEALSHLDYLLSENLITRKDTADNRRLYSLTAEYSADEGHSRAKTEPDRHAAVHSEY